MTAGDSIASFLTTVVFVLGALVLSKRLGVSAFWPIFAGFVLSVSGVLRSAPQSPLYTGIGDGRRYLDWATQISTGFRTGDLDPQLLAWPSKSFFPILVAGGQLVFGDLYFAIILGNASLLGLSLLVLQKSASLIDRATTARSVAFLYLSNPAIHFWGPSLLRESIFWFGISLTILGLARLKTSPSLASTVWISVGVVVQLLVRPNFGVVSGYLFVGMAVFIGVVYSGWPRVARILALGASGLALFWSFPAAFGWFSIPENPTQRIAQKFTSLGKDSVTTSVGLDNQSFAEPPASALGLLVGGLKNFLNAIGGPTSGQINSEAVWILIVASQIWFLAVLGMHLAQYFVGRANFEISWPMTVGSAALIFAIAIVITNFGALARFRAGAEILLIPLAAGCVTKIDQILTSRKPAGPVGNLG